MSHSETRRILIWGKTYPELSERHRETVCTGGCFENGEPVRIYPVPLRYLPRHNRYALYDWIEVPVTQSTNDRRPESFKVHSDSLRRVDHAGPEKGWLERRKHIFANRGWHFDCLDDLKRLQRSAKRSLGLIRVGAIEKVYIEERSREDAEKHQKKLLRLCSRLDLFDSVYRDLEFLPFRVRVHWRCWRLTGPHACGGHTAAVLDWGLGELGRRNGRQAALQRMEALTDLSRIDLRFFVGNFKAHPGQFGIIGLWYPKKADVEMHSHVQEALL